MSHPNQKAPISDPEMSTLADPKLTPADAEEGRSSFKLRSSFRRSSIEASFERAIDAAVPREGSTAPIHGYFTSDAFRAAQTMGERRPVKLGRISNAGPSNSMSLSRPAETRVDGVSVSPAGDYACSVSLKGKQRALAAAIGLGISTNTNTVSAAGVNGHDVRTGAAVPFKGKGKQRADRAPLDTETIPIGNSPCTQDIYGNRERQQQSSVFAMLETAPTPLLPTHPSPIPPAPETRSSSPAFQEDALSPTDPLRYYALYCNALGVVEPGESARPAPTSDSAIELDVLKAECCGHEGCGSGSAASLSPSLPTDQADLIEESNTGEETRTADQPAQGESSHSALWACVRLGVKILVGVLLVAAFGGAFVGIPLAPDDTAGPGLGPVNGTMGPVNGTGTTGLANSMLALTNSTSLTARRRVPVVRDYIPPPFTASLSPAQKAALCNKGISTWCAAVPSANSTDATPAPASPSHGAQGPRTPTFTFMATCAFLLCVVGMYCILHVGLRWCLAGRRKGGSGGIVDVRSLALEGKVGEGWWEFKWQGFGFVAVVLGWVGLYGGSLGRLGVVRGDRGIFGAVLKLCWCLFVVHREISDDATLKLSM
ncbi:hypothetical protein IQ07DRAFT_597727 [Pyrenochaeta sp. DS3sAY3a]|nr:hypothetical protein IQ07DRAFT_597727 [Pyrenochaeta sp. DS3sAY3a]